MHRRPLPLRKNRLFSIRFLVRHVIRHPSQRGGERDDVSAGCGVRRRDGWHFRLFDLWPSTNGLFSRQLNTISFENDSELTYGIILTNFGTAFAFALPRFTQLKCKHKRKCKQKEMTFFLFLASALGWPLGFLFPFHTQPKKTLGTGFARLPLVRSQAHRPSKLFWVPHVVWGFEFFMRLSLHFHILRYS